MHNFLSIVVTVCPVQTLISVNTQANVVRLFSIGAIATYLEILRQPAKEDEHPPGEEDATDHVDG